MMSCHDPGHQLVTIRLKAEVSICDDTDKLVLIIAKKLITLHSGQMHYESVKGTGTTFTILFPAVKEQAHS